jgi:drug/metabolite transporter (DMT)-like permease
MTSLLLSIISFSAMMLIFKLIERFKADTFQAIVYNYITAAILGFSILDVTLSIPEITHAAWFQNAIVVGASFITLFYVIGLTAQKVGISVSTVANKMSVVIPVVFAFFLYGDNVTVFKVLGIALALAGVFMATKKDEKVALDKKFIILPIILFIGSGLLDTFVNYTEKFFLPDEVASMNFIPTVFTVSGIAGGFVLIARLISTPSAFSLQSVFWGVLLGFFNYASLYFILQALKFGNMESSVVFTINNIGIVTLSTVSARIFFKEHLTRLNITGISLAIIAILLIAFS